MIFFYQCSFGQKNDKETAIIYAKQAEAFEKEGKLAEALKLLESAQKLDPDNIEYRYEIAGAYYLMKDYNKVIKILEKLLTHKNVFGKIYHLLGNAYDDLKNRTKAIEIYETGLKLFPHTGEIYLELGNFQLLKNDYNGALVYYEKGIKMNPGFSSNYYRAAKLFLKSTEKAWGMIYGEIFLLLERNTKRTAEINKLLYDTYKKQVSLNIDSSWSVNFGTSTLPDATAAKDSTGNQLPFIKSVYEPLLKSALKNEKTIDINSLSRARMKFIETYYKTEAWQKYPNILFDFQYKILKTGNLDAYNHWLLSEGNFPDFEKWRDANNDQYVKFYEWFITANLIVDENYKFCRDQY